MSKKKEIEKEIEECELEIKSLEQKLMRSQTSLMESLLDKTEPDPIELEFFRVFSKLVKHQRSRLADLNEELKSL